MLPTVFIDGPYRFYFFSREETRRHIHVSSPNGEVKIWLEPNIQIAKNINLAQKELSLILKIVQERELEINEFWNKHFS